MQPPPDGFVIQTDLAGDLADCIVVYQPQVEHTSVGFIVDVFFDYGSNLLIAIIRA